MKNSVRLINATKNRKLLLCLFLTSIVLMAVGVTATICISYKNPVEKPTVASKVVEAVKPVKDCSITDDKVIVAVNKYRLEIGLSPVYPNNMLDTMADNRASEQNGSLDNHEPFKPYLDSHLFGDYFSQNAEIQNFMTTIPGRECDSADDRVANFKKSTPHWNAITNSRYDSIGVGFVNNELVIEFGDSF